MYSLLANLVLIVHVAFVIFVVCGGLLVPKWRRVAWLHLPPAAAWDAIIEFTGVICPLTIGELVGGNKPAKPVTIHR
jgi:Protein of Unknown function (DUF2784)